MNTPLISAPEPEGQPLCRSYVSVLFDAFPVQVSGEDGAYPKQMLWAVGVLSDGLPDYLGSWWPSGPTDLRWRSITDDFKARGIERIRFVIGPDPLEMNAAMAAHYRYGNWDCMVLPASGLIVEPSLIDSLLPGHRPYIERAIEIATPLSRRLKRAVARHGGFANPAAAAALLRQSSERYIYANWPEPPDLPTSRSPVPRSTAGSGLAAVGC